jgi:hypothetical protein
MISAPWTHTWDAEVAAEAVGLDLAQAGNQRAAGMGLLCAARAADGADLPRLVNANVGE